MSKKKEARFVFGLPGTIVNNGYPFTHKKVNVEKTTALYWCRQHHSCECNTKIKLQLPSGSVFCGIGFTS